MNNYTIKHIEVPPPIPYNTSKTFIGFDPGTVHSGFAVIYPKSVHIYQVTAERDNNAIRRMYRIRHIWRKLQLSLPFSFIAIIEGAAFGSNYRQVELAEVRTAFAMELAMWDTELVMYEKIGIEIVAPSSIRKKVFGSAKFKAHEVWTTLYDVNNFEPVKDCPDALAALSCAYYGLLTEE